MPDPRTKLLGSLDVTTAHGLEIGALHNPRVTRSDGNISYLDHLSAEGLREKYSGNAQATTIAASAVELDYVWRPGQRLTDAVGGQTFDYVIASHVLEHVPNPIGWIEQVREVLVPGGRLALVLPDKRFCFDVNRGLTTMADLVDAHLRKLDVPSFRQIYDFEANYVPTAESELWAGKDTTGLRRPDVTDPDRYALQCCIEQAGSSDGYRDVHCHTFTPASFLDLIELGCRLELVNLELLSFYPTDFGHLEFFVTLTRQDPVDRARQLESVSAGRAALDGAPEVTPPPPEAEDREVSDLEWRLVALKRSAMWQLRRLRHKS